MISLLERQLARLQLSAERAPTPEEWKQFLTRVDRSYGAADQDRYRLQRSVEISSEEMRQLNEQVQKQRDKLEAVVGSMGDGLIVADRAGKLTSINTAGEGLLGWRGAEIVGDHLADIISGYRIPIHERRRNIARLRSALAEGREARDDDARWVTRELRTAHVSWMLTPLVQHGMSGGFVLLFRDIGNHRAMLSALVESEARFRAAFEASPIGMLRVDSSGAITQANLALTRMLGFDPVERRARLDDLAHPEDRPRATQLFAELFAGRRDSYHLEQRLGQGNGGVRWGSVSMAIIDSTAQHRHAAIATIEDLTERKALEVELRHAQKLESVGFLAAGIAHEINTPIQFVGDNLQFLKESFVTLVRSHGCPDADEGDCEVDYLRTEVPVAIEQTVEGINQVASIVRALKAFAHPGTETEQTATDINQALTNTLIVARNEYRYIADVDCDFGELPLVRCYPGDLNQVLLNLIINAAHAIAEVQARTGERGRLELRTRVVGDRVVIAIGDTGGGIPPEIAPRIFDPFFTTKPVGKGTGQGLAIVHGVVIEKHGGTVRFETEVGKGTTFVVELPIAGRPKRAGGTS